jgi:hypothetical protein
VRVRPNRQDRVQRAGSPPLYGPVSQAPSSAGDPHKVAVSDSDRYEFMAKVPGPFGQWVTRELGDPGPDGPAVADGAGSTRARLLQRQSSPGTSPPDTHAEDG